jgi:hypothetical protein
MIVAYPICDEKEEILPVNYKPSPDEKKGPPSSNVSNK